MLNKGGQLKLPEPRNPEDVGKTDDPRYCLYHRALGHPTKSCWSLKDKLQALVDVGALRLKTKQKTATANMTSCIQFGQSPPTPTTVYPIPAVEMRVINSDPHCQQEKELVRTTLPGVEQCGYTSTFLTKSLPGPRLPARSPEAKPSRQMPSSPPALNLTRM